MTITVYGVPPNIDKVHWARLFQAVGDSNAGMSVRSGFDVTTAGSGARLLNVSAGISLQAGTLAEMSPNSTVTLGANTGTQPRIDVVCLQVDWSGSATTAGSLVAVPGVPAAAPVAPALTQTEGVLWQTPLAKVTVLPGVGIINSAQVAAAKAAGKRTESGTLAITPSAANVATAVTVNFARAFSSPPDVICSYNTPLSDGATSYSVGAWATAVTTTSFRATVRRSNTTTMNVTWIAAGV